MPFTQFMYFSINLSVFYLWSKDYWQKVTMILSTVLTGVLFSLFPCDHPPHCRGLVTKASKAPTFVVRMDSENVTLGLQACTWPAPESSCQFVPRWPWGFLHSGCCPAPLPLLHWSWSRGPSLHTLHKTKHKLKKNKCGSLLRSTKRQKEWLTNPFLCHFHLSSISKITTLTHARAIYTGIHT